MKRNPYVTQSPIYPTVEWGSRRNERWSSKQHYDRGNGYTVCGLKIRRYPSGGDGFEDMCERCLKIEEGKHGR